MPAARSQPRVDRLPLAERVGLAPQEPCQSRDDGQQRWVDGLGRLTAGDCCGAADCFYEAVRLELDELRGRPRQDSHVLWLMQQAPLLAEVLEAHHDSAGAADLLDFAYERGSRDGETTCRYIELLLKRRELELAAHLLRQARELDPSDRVVRRLQETLDRIGRQQPVARRLHTPLCARQIRPDSSQRLKGGNQNAEARCP